MIFIGLPFMFLASHWPTRKPFWSLDERTWVMTLALVLSVESITTTLTPAAVAALAAATRPSRIARIEDQQVDALGDHVLDVGDLLAHVVLAVGRDHLAAGLLGLLVGRGFLRGEIGRVERVHRDADLAVGRLGSADRKRRGSGEQGDFQSGSHWNLVLPLGLQTRICRAYRHDFSPASPPSPQAQFGSIITELMRRQLD